MHQLENPERHLWATQGNPGLGCDLPDISSNLQGLFDIPDIAGKSHQVGLLRHYQAQQVLTGFVDGKFTDNHRDPGEVTAAGCQAGEGQ